MLVRAIKTKIFEENEDIFSFIISHIPKVEENNILVITSKILSLAQGRTIALADVGSKEDLIRKESELAIRGKRSWLTIREGVAMGSAGIDLSNSQEGKYILLPRDCAKHAYLLKERLRKKYGLKNFGLIISDSRSTPFKAAAMGAALAYAGFKGIKDYRGSKDIFARQFKATRVNVAHSLAAAAVLEMGEGSERCPLALISDVQLEFVSSIINEEINIRPEEDMYLDLYKYLLK